MSLVGPVEQEVLEPGERSLPELAAAVERAHAGVGEAVATALEYAFSAGQALLEAREKCPEGTWLKWIDTNLSFSAESANAYMRVAYYRNEILSEGIRSVVKAMVYLRGLPPVHGPSSNGRAYSDELREEARRLVQAGASPSGTANLLGVHPQTVQRWVDPAYAAEIDRRATKQRAQRRVERRAEKDRARERAREQTVKRAVGKAGTAAQKLYAICERLQDDIAQAHSEATDPEARRHYALMGEHYRKMRDEGVRALGIS